VVKKKKYKTNLKLLNLYDDTKLYNNHTVLHTQNKTFSNDIMQKRTLQALNSYIHIFTGHDDGMLDNILYTISPTGFSSTGIVHWTCRKGILEPNS
jgi:hypothetical protein